MKALASLHLADLFRDPAMKWPTRLDWSKIPRILAGTYPQAFPAIETDPRRLVWESGMSFDTEYTRDTKYLIRFSAYTPSGGLFVIEAKDWFRQAWKVQPELHDAFAVHTLQTVWPPTHARCQEDRTMCKVLPRERDHEEAAFVPPAPEAISEVRHNAVHSVSPRNASTTRVPAPVTEVGLGAHRLQPNGSPAARALSDLPASGATTGARPRPQDDGRSGSPVLILQHGNWHDAGLCPDVTAGRVVPFEIVFQNAVVDLPHLARILPSGVVIRVQDCLLAHALLWSEWPHDLGFLASLYSPYPKTKHLSDTNPIRYAAGDALDTWTIWQSLKKELALDPRVRSVYEAQSLPLIPHLIAAHARGIRVNRSRVVPANDQLSARLSDSTQLASAHAGFPINVGSDDQLAHWLYTVEGLPTQTHKKTRRPTIDADAIAALRQHVGPAPDLEGEERDGLTIEQAEARIQEGGNPVLEARVIYAAAQQSLSHYIKPCYKDGELVDRLYPQFKIHAQASGRWSTTDPPMAQLPSDLRDIVCPDEGHAWIIFDWDGIELRLMAALAQDHPYLETFAKGWDIHTLNACAIFQLPLPPDRLNPHTGESSVEWRSLVSWQGKDDTRRVFAKRFVYRLNYGGDPKKAGDIPGAQLLGLTPLKLVKASENLLAAHPAIATWRRQAAQDARQNGVSYTFMGRRRRLLGEGKAVEREAFNHPLQGGVADMFNITFLRIVEALPDAEFMFQLHDSFYWQVPLAQVEEAEATIREIAEREWDVYGQTMRVPITLKTRVA